MALSLRASAEVRAAPSLVFDVITAPERLPEWNVSVERARRVEAGPVQLGSRSVATGRLLGQSLESETEVVAFEPPAHFATRAVRGPRLHTSFRLGTCEAGTRIELEVTGEVPGGALGGFVAERFLRTELDASLQRLRLLCEREAAAAG